jgi:hypothetical protein
MWRSAAAETATHRRRRPSLALLLGAISNSAGQSESRESSRAYLEVAGDGNGGQR